MTTAEILRGAADYLREHGWIQGQPYNEQGQACLVGAIETTISTSPAFNAVELDAFSNAIEATYQTLGGSTGVGVSIWNDQEGRTAEEVIELLEKAADTVEARGT